MKSFFRFLYRNKLYTFIEVAGMSVAIAFVIFIASFIIGEMRYDRQLKDTDNIFIGHSERLFLNSATVKGQLEGRFPEVQQICRYTSTTLLAGVPMYLRIGDQEIRQNAGIADSCFFSMFTFPLSAGDAGTALASYNSVAVSESFASTWFKDKDPIGQTFTLISGDRQETVTVSAVFRDLKETVFPENDIFYSYRMMERLYPSLLNNGNGTSTVFFRLTPGADTESLADHMEDILKKEDMLYLFDMFHEFRLSPFREIHFAILDENAPFEGVIKKDFIRIFMAAGVLLLVFALLNYISLTVAQTGFRAQEMATRRLLGSSRQDIIARYIGEAFILTAFSFLLSLLFSELFAGPMSELIGKEVAPLTGMGLPLAAFCSALVLLLAVCAGMVPALVVSKFRPVDIVKGEFSRVSRMTLGRIFVIIQNTVAIASLSIALVMLLQIRYMCEKPMGYRKDGLVSVLGAGKASEYYVDELRQLPCVDNIGWLQWNPMGDSHSGQGFQINGETVHFDMYFGDRAAFDILGFEVISQNAEPANQTAWLTESAMRSLGLDYGATAIELDGGGMIPVCGIMKDFTKGNAQSVNNSEFILCYWIKEMEQESDFMTLRELVIKAKGDTREAVRQIRDFYLSKGISEDEMLIQDYNQINRKLYSGEDMNLKLISVFAGLILVLSSLAMVAMSTYYGKQHAANTAVKKVFGCSRGQIYIDTARGFIVSVAIAAAMAVPLGYIVSGIWLGSYSYRIGNSLWIYLAAAAAVMLLALISITWQTVRLMDTDPVKALKNE